MNLCSKGVVNEGSCPIVVGNPITVSLGHKVQSELDYSVSGYSLFKIERSYSSSDRLKYVTGFGQNWFLKQYSKKLDLQIEDSQVVAVNAIRDLGSIERFELNNQVWVPSNTHSGEIESVTLEDGSDGYHYISKSGMNHEYYSSDGSVLYFLDRYGKQVSLSYSTETTVGALVPREGLLIEVRDQNNRTLSFTYNGNSQIDTISTSNGEVFTYHYNEDNLLAEVVYPDGSNKEYLYQRTIQPEQVIADEFVSEAYDEGFQLNPEVFNLSSFSYVSVPASSEDTTSEVGVVYEEIPEYSSLGQDSLSQTVFKSQTYVRLSNIVDESSNVYASWEYDNQGRAVHSYHGNEKESVRLSFNSSVTTVTNALGKKTNYIYEKVGNKNLITQVNGESSVSCLASDSFYTYDANGYKETHTDAENNVTRTNRDSEGRITNEERGLSWVNGVDSYFQRTGDSQKTVTTWHNEYDLPTKREYYYWGRYQLSVN